MILLEQKKSSIKNPFNLTISKIISNFHFNFQIKNGKTRNWQFPISIELENKMILLVHGLRILNLF